LADKSCNTEEGGPNEHRQCTFPFVWKGQLHNHCAHSNTPSFHNEKCRILIDKYPDIFENVVSHHDYEEKDHNKGGIVLQDEAGNVITTCYSPHPGRFGW
jgi:hypothetical protein